jgi:hypothetical protein
MLFSLSSTRVNAYLSLIIAKDISLDKTGIEAFVIS